MALDAATLALIKVDYEESSLTVAAIGEKYGHSPSYISRLARIHGWILRTQRLGRTPRMSAVLSQQARALIAHRLCSIINKKLDQMEKDMDSGVLTFPDLERDSKTIGSMVVGVERIVPRLEEDKVSKRDALKQHPSPTTRQSCDFSSRLSSALSASSAAGKLREDLSELDAAQLEYILAHWPLWARPDQLPPAVGRDGEAWRVWLILGGRGAGKTRAGAEWVRARALGRSLTAARRIALVGETFADVRRVMIEGDSGLLAVHHASERPHFEPSKGQLVWTSGALAQMFSAEEPDSLRGPQFDAAWCDEVAKWRHPGRTWDMLQFALRLGAHPQMVATTTPRATAFLKELLADAGTVVTRAATADNADNLAPTFVAEMTRRYAGTALGRQELFGDIVDDTSGALWRRDWIEAHRVAGAPELAAIVVAVDPPVTATAASDACGIVVAGLGPDGRADVIADRTLQGREPQVWARAVIAAYGDFLADRVVAEVNQGGDLVTTVLRQIDANVTVRTVRATRGKWLRAEPVAALYAEGRVAHVGTFEALEDQMCAFGADGLSKGRSPDRLDALVWALTDLMVGAAGRPAIRRL